MKSWFQKNRVLILFILVWLMLAGLDVTVHPW